EYHGKTELETVVKYGKKELVEGTDYTVSYKNNTKAGTATVTYKGIGNYSGSFNKTFKITPIDLNKNTITVAEIEDQPYQKGGNKPDIDAYDSDNRTQLVLNKDYTLSYKNNTKQGTATVTVKGKGNYTGTLNRTFKIVPADIGNVTATAQDKAYANKVNAYKSTIVLTDLNGKKLKVGTDYDKNVTYTYAASGQPVGANDIPDADTVITVTAKGLGNYTGTVSADYRIVKASIAKASVKVPNQTYTGNPITLKKEEITVKVGKDVLKPEDFEIVSYSNNVNKGTATVVIKGVGNYGGTKTVKFKIVQRNFCQLIRFNANAEGATGKMTSQFIFANTKLKANAFKCPGKTFVGWSVDPNTSPDDVQNIIPNKGVFPYELKKAGLITDLYAIWK
ncbi:MAG: hypothetical protein J5365_04190, partial [Erysipelotrichaceae bacterium]|nr:hypothetical protein [Erysipelotrichaceae bacterium]